MTDTPEEKALAAAMRRAAAIGMKNMAATVHSQIIAIIATVDNMPPLVMPSAKLERQTAMLKTLLTVLEVTVEDIEKMEAQEEKLQ